MLRTQAGRMILWVAVVLLGLCTGQRGAWAEEEPSPGGETGPAGPVLRFHPAVEERVRTLLGGAGLDYPLRDGVSMLVFKQEKRLEVWAHTGSGPRFLKQYPVLAMSGQAGPKRQQGDRQVPEGLYRIVWFNPNSAFHLSLKLDYPNAFDLRKAEEEGRTEPGGDIFIHGGAASTGCIAVGDAAIEELFVLTLMAGDGPAEVIIAPHDFRRKPIRMTRRGGPAWLPALYREVADRLERYAVASATD
ncbi:MAG: L,D-transpeptidase family protein [Magnetococcus sp. DMHC-8]